MGIDDLEYLKTGAHIVESKKAYELDIICQPKFCQGDLEFLTEGKTVFGWLHLDECPEMLPVLQEKHITAISWELMFDRGIHVFYKNNRLTGTIGVLHSVAYTGKAPKALDVAVMGKGLVGKAATKCLRDLA